MFSRRNIILDPMTGKSRSQNIATVPGQFLLKNAAAKKKYLEVCKWEKNIYQVSPLTSVLVRFSLRNSLIAGTRGSSVLTAIFTGLQ